MTTPSARSGGRSSKDQRRSPRPARQETARRGESGPGKGRARAIYRPGQAAAGRRPLAARRPSASAGAKPASTRPATAQNTSTPSGSAQGTSARAAAATAAVLPATEAAPAPEHRGGHHLRLVERAARTPLQRRRRRRYLLTGAVSLTLGVVFALVYLHVLLAQRQFELNRLQAEDIQAQSTYQQRRLEVAQLAAPSRIIAVAEGHLGMVQPTSVTYLHDSSTTASKETVSKEPASKNAKGTTSTDAKAGGVGRLGPAGDANWSRMKALLAGRP